LSENFPTAAVAIIDFETTAWPDIAAGDGHLVEFVTPKGIDRTD
jgi:phosphohistidine phosphatase